MALWLTSDFHLADATTVAMFDEAEQGKNMAALCARIAGEGEGELVLLGDIFDLTAMQPPPRGVAKFGKKMGIELHDAPERDPVAMCAAVKQRHTRTIAAIAGLPKSVRVTLVPGNHDHYFGAAVGRAALDAAGLERVEIATEVVREIADRCVLLQHGHALDAANAAPGGDGEMLTRVMHHALVPMLERITPPPNVRVDPLRLATLRPEERMVPVLERWLGERAFARFTAALTDLLVDVGALSRVEAWFVTAEKLRERLDDADGLWERVGVDARAALAGKKALSADAPRPDVLVLGHTHVPDWVAGDVDEGAERQRLYVNLGSWTCSARDALGPIDDTLPVLRIDAPSRGLRATLEELASGRVVASFDGSVSPPRGQP